MAQILQGGNAAVQALLYGDVDPGTQRYFESQRQSTFGNLTETARSFAKESIQRFGFMATERTKRLIGDVRRAANWAWHGDYIRPLRTIDDIQLASPVMIRYVMAEPMTRAMYHQGQVSGYDEAYVDHHPTRIGENHSDYTRVMNGIVVVDETPDDEGEYGWTATTYLDDAEPEEEQLDFSQQLDILETWAHVRQAIVDRGKDPTSLCHASLE